MPLVQVTMLQGRTADQKRKLAQRITDVLVEEAGARREAVVVAFHEVSKESYASTMRFYERSGYDEISRIKDFYRIEDDKVVEIGKDEILAKVTSETCRKCHNKDAPNHKPFAFNKFLKQIAHLDPRKKRPADYLDTLPAEPTDEEGADKVEFRK